jgi:hypothetical protein
MTGGVLSGKGQLAGTASLGDAGGVDVAAPRSVVDPDWQLTETPTARIRMGTPFPIRTGMLL